MSVKEIHNFHIPVMGLGFTVDTPVKVAKYGISSVVSIIQDSMIEKMRAHWCKEFNRDYDFVSNKEEDFRAKRITRYLDLLNDIVNQQFEELRNSSFEKDSELTKYFELLPEDSPLKETYKTFMSITIPELKKGLEVKLRQEIKPGKIDVNIMTKVDKTNYASSGEALSEEFSDALSALRGYALSNLNSSIVFSAGLNPRLYSYTENFNDFYPDEKGEIKKKIVIKVSDYRSALIQGKFLAKKGLWVSEFRIESGLNCGGHAFATEGYLLGPILEEFKINKTKLTEELHGLFVKGLAAKGRKVFEKPLPLKLTVQGGIGTFNEHNFLLKHYELDATGWGTPFLLVPEATQVDEQTLNKLANAGKEDVYLSQSSPLGVGFNTLRNSSGQEEKRKRAEKGKPGSPCLWKHLSFNTEFTERPICTASRKYQKLKIDELKTLSLPHKEYQKQLDKIIEKECLCDGLANAALINTGALGKDKPVSICPGPNIAYFSRIASLREMVDHIYGRINLITVKNRPNMFVNEAVLYLEYLQNEVKSIAHDFSEKQFKSLNTFKSNLLQGINYYKDLIVSMKEESYEYQMKLKAQLAELESKICSITIPEISLCLTK